MINPQLLNYVRAQRAAGVSREDIINALAGGGWSAQDANEAFAAIEGVQVPPAAPKPPPPPAQPIQPVAAAPITPPATPAAAPAMAPRPVPVGFNASPAPVQQPMSMRPQPAAVIQPRPACAQPKRRRVWPWLTFAFLMFLFGAVGGAYAALQFPFVASTIELLTGVAPAEEQSINEEAPSLGNEGGGFDLSTDGAGSFEEIPATSTPTSTPTTIVE